MKETFCKKISGTFVGSMFPAHYMESKKSYPQVPFSCTFAESLFSSTCREHASYTLKKDINIHKSDTINMTLGTILPKRYLFPLVEHIQS